MRNVTPIRKHATSKDTAGKKVTSIKLTNAIIEATIYPPEELKECEIDPKHKLKRMIVWDTEVRGLGIRVFPSGKKSFILRYSSQHRFKGERLITIGDFPTITLFKARRLASTKKEEVYQGHDPLTERRHKASHRAPFSEVALRYLAEYSEGRKKKSVRSDRVRIQNRLIPQFEKKPISDITTAELNAFFISIGVDHPIEANRILGLFAHIHKMAKIWGLVDKREPNPTEGIKRYTERKRERVLSDQETARLLATADAYVENNEDIENVDPRIGSLIRLFLLTAARKNELLELKWSDIDFESGSIRFEDTKAKRDHVLRPGPAALEILAKLKKLEEKGNNYVFPGKKPGTCRKDFRRPWRKIIKDAGIEGLTVHDLRRSVGTWLAREGAGQYVIQKVLNQTEAKAALHYIHLAGRDTESPLALVEEKLKRLTKDTNKVDAIKKSDK